MDWLPGWSYRRTITVTEKSGSDLVDYQVLIELNSSNFNFNHAKDDGSDIRFHDGDVFLNYWIEKWDKNNQEAKVWVKVPSIPANGNTSFYMHYGNPDAEDESDGENTFDFFDDFEGTEVDTDKWNVYEPDGIDVHDSYCDITGVGDGVITGIRAKVSFGFGYALRAKSKAFEYNDGRNWAGWSSGKNGSNFARVKYDNDGCGYYSKRSDNEYFLHAVTLDTDFHVFEIIRKSNVSLIFVTEGVDEYVEDATGAIPQVDLYPIFTNWKSGRKTRVDWVLVRKYANNDSYPNSNVEPEVSVGDEESAPQALLDVFQLSDNSGYTYYGYAYSLSDISIFCNSDSLSYTSCVPVEDSFSFVDDLFLSKVAFTSVGDILLDLLDTAKKIVLSTSCEDLLSLEDCFNLSFFSKISSGISFSDKAVLSFPNLLFDVFSLYDIYSLSLTTKISELLPSFLKDIKLSFFSSKKDVFILSDLLKSSAILNISFKDILTFLDALLPLGKPEARIFFSLIPYPENLFYSLYSTSIKITGIDGILTAEDGIYIFDEERTTGDLMFRFGNMSSSRLKRIDKIFASTPLEKATVYADESSYSYIGNKWISCGKGLKGKELKVLLENLGDIEFVSFRLVELRRPK